MCTRTSRRPAQSWCGADQSTRGGDDVGIRGGVLESRVDELLDEEALQRAKTLRGQVRSDAARVKELQDSVLEKAVEMTAQQVKQTSIKTPAKPSVPLLDPAQAQAQVQGMQEALSTMQKTLESTKQAIPAQLVRLQQSVQAIDSDLGKSLSQTEQALGKRFDHQSSGSHHNLPPEQRLAEFLRD